MIWRTFDDGDYSDGTTNNVPFEDFGSPVERYGQTFVFFSPLAVLVIDFRRDGGVYDPYQLQTVHVRAL